MAAVVNRGKAAPRPKKAAVPNEFQTQIGAIFGIAQGNLATHRKQINVLHGLFLRAVALTEETESGLLLTGEKLFADGLRANLLHVLGVKKGVEPADRIVKFVAGFVAFAIEHEGGAEGATEDDDEEEEEGPAARLVPHLVHFFMSGFRAKDKAVRFRCVQLMALMISSLGEIDDDLYGALKIALLERVHDKEAPVRMQATVALSKLQMADDDDAEPSGNGQSRRPGDSDVESDEEEEEAPSVKVRDVLLDVLEHDPANEVRRAALFNLIPSPQTLPALVARTLDVDGVNRRAVLQHVLLQIPVRVLAALRRPKCSRDGSEMLRDVLRRGLRDREPSVQRAATKLLVRWVADAGGVRALLVLLGREALATEPALTKSVLEAVFAAAPGALDELGYGDDAFYMSLTAESATILRHYLAYLGRTDPALVSEVEPGLTTLAAEIGRRWGEYVRTWGEGDNEGWGRSDIAGADIPGGIPAVISGRTPESAEEGAAQPPSPTLTASQALAVIQELIRTAELVEGDEIGRRHVFEVMRQMLVHTELPAALIPDCIDVLLKGTSEKDAVQVVVELVQHLRDESSLVTSESEDDDETRIMRTARKPRMSLRTQLMTPSRQSAQIALRRKELDLRCLTIIQALFERVMGTLQENSMIHGLVAELIVPAVKTKDFDVRSAGLMCLGLCCLLDVTMAQDSFELFAQQTQSGDINMQVRTLQVIFDFLLVHGLDFGQSRGFGQDVMKSFLANCLEQEEPEFLAVAVVGVAKLLLGGVVADEAILKQLVLLYFAAETRDNQPLRQSLSYFFPVYCYSNSENQKRVARIAVDTLLTLKDYYDETPERDDMVTPLQIGVQFIDWTDPAKALKLDARRHDNAVQAILAIDLLKALYISDDKETRKILAHTVAKLVLPDDLDDTRAMSVVALLKGIADDHPVAETLPRNALKRFQTAVTKQFGEGSVKPESPEDLAEIYDFLNQNKPTSSDSKPKPKPQKRSKSVVKDESSDDESDEESSASDFDD